MPIVTFLARSALLGPCGGFMSPRILKVSCLGIDTRGVHNQCWIPYTCS